VGGVEDVAVVVGEVEFPASVGGDDALEVFGVGEGVEAMGVLGTGLIGDQRPDIAAIDFVGG